MPCSLKCSSLTAILQLSFSHDSRAKVARRGTLTDLEQWCATHDELFPLLAARAACEELALHQRHLQVVSSHEPGQRLASSLQACPLPTNAACARVD